uniref:CBS domain-containing protein n=1 Tax=Chromera velia CCMP2878 TaxID=1169474 RepID=A0A0G4H8P4_9ALVE|eukprot:Cvel_25234.t1-p1 / transcript=Cvel_25234.t1 / gene=Cvel_25234 / organism=Chromera_velia_CCMP2878 / gene_product=hypothetical protein / transcript_product=hypothetical protein / location=Cvel_scaffold2830:9161-16083(+) / protein_length=752 / sequence_SO=supercontig / SO=protein_coding / is_pseudo=false
MSGLPPEGKAGEGAASSAPPAAPAAAAGGGAGDNPSASAVAPVPSGGSGTGTAASEIAATQSRIRDLFDATFLYEFVPENSKIVVLDTRVPMHVAIRSLFDYKKSFACLYSHNYRNFVGMLGPLELVDFFVWFYHTDPNTSLPNRTGFPPALDSIQGQAGVEGGVGEEYTQQDAGDGGGQEWEGERAKGESASTAPRVMPFDLTVEEWRDLAEIPAFFPFISAKRTLLDAAKMLIETDVPQIAVWNDERGSPLAFTSLFGVLTHWVQQLRGQHDILEKKIRQDLHLGSQATVMTVPTGTPLAGVLHFLRVSGVSAIPVVDKETGAYVGCFGRAHFVLLLGRALQAQEVHAQQQQQHGGRPATSQQPSGSGSSSSGPSGGASAAPAAMQADSMPEASAAAWAQKEREREAAAGAGSGSGGGGPSSRSGSGATWADPTAAAAASAQQRVNEGVLDLDAPIEAFLSILGLGASPQAQGACGNLVQPSDDPRERERGGVPREDSQQSRGRGPIWASGSGASGSGGAGGPHAPDYPAAPHGTPGGASVAVPGLHRQTSEGGASSIAGFGSVRLPGMVPPDVYARDVTLKDTIARVLLSESRRMILCDPVTHKPTGVTTVTDLSRFLIDWDPIQQMLQQKSQQQHQQQPQQRPPAQSTTSAAEPSSSPPTTTPPPSAAAPPQGAPASAAPAGPGDATVTVPAAGPIPPENSNGMGANAGGGTGGGAPPTRSQSSGTAWGAGASGGSAGGVGAPNPPQR